MKKLILILLLLISAFSYADNLNPNNNSNQTNKETINLLEKKIEILQDFNRAIELEPSNLEFFKSRARLFLDMAKIEKDAVKKKEYEENSQEDFKIANG